MEKSSSNSVHDKRVQSFYNSFASGFVAGAVAKFCGHPLDTVKTRIQVSGSRLGLHQQFTRILQTEGLCGLYKGVTSPVVGNAPLLAMFFAANEMAKNAISHLNLSQGMMEFIPGCWSGASVLLFTLPIEVLKVQKQGRIDNRSSYSEMVRNIMRKEGIRGLYRGFGISFWLWVPHCGLYFYNYDKLQRIFHSRFSKNSTNDKNVLLGKIFAGGIAGQIGWLISYPFDSVKTYVQWQPENRNFTKAFKHLKAKYGLGYFYRGCSVAMLRAFPVSAITLCVYDYVHNILKHA